MGLSGLPAAGGFQTGGGMLKRRFAEGTTRAIENDRGIDAFAEVHTLNPSPLLDCSISCQTRCAAFAHQRQNLLRLPKVAGSTSHRKPQTLGTVDFLA
jgi:hypothetical protein